MIITKTPFRISFFGGGTDIAEFFNEEGGQVLSAAIDKYCYVTVRDLPPFFNHSIRLAYSKLETCTTLNEIQHPLIRAALIDFSKNHIEIHHDADLPGNSGLGSSSAFGVGLANALSFMNGSSLTKRQLAEKVIYWERYFLNEAGGFQDQIASAYGGINHISFKATNNFEVEEFSISKDLQNEMLNHMILCYIPKTRLSSDVSVARQVTDKKVRNNLRFIRDSVSDGISLLKNKDLNQFGRLLHEAWLKKREFGGVTDRDIDSIYSNALNAGALGGKLLGAGGGGFMLLWCSQDNREKVIAALGNILIVPFKFDFAGSEIIYCNENNHTVNSR